jgi:N-methylhydantoinase B
LGKCIMDPATDDEVATPSKFIGTMKRGQVFRGEMPGSGGHGYPFKRDVDAVLEDVRQEKVSLEHARTAYGVVINDDGVDVAATAKLRSV